MLLQKTYLVWANNFMHLGIQYVSIHRSILMSINIVTHCPPSKMN
jgi:hypothetical protein